MCKSSRTSQNYNDTVLQFSVGTNYVYAQFTRPALLEFVNPEDGTTEVNDLDNESFYLIMASGAIVAGFPTEHDSEEASTDMIDFCGDACGIAINSEFDYSTCGEDKTCYGFPEGCLDTKVKAYYKQAHCSLTICCVVCSGL